LGLHNRRLTPPATNISSLRLCGGIKKQDPKRVLLYRFILYRAEVIRRILFCFDATGG